MGAMRAQERNFAGGEARGATRRRTNSHFRFGNGSYLRDLIVEPAIRAEDLIMKLLPLVLLATVGSAPSEWTVGSGRIGLAITHKLHKVHGGSSRVSGKARLSPDGRAQVEIAVEAGSFDTHNVNRDVHLKEAIEAAKFPAITLKAVGEVRAPTSFPSHQEARFDAQLDFHGVKQAQTIPIELEFESADRVRAKSHFTISLDAFGVERPSLMFVKVEDQAEIDADVTFEKR
jgi:polyisoprenoid-binding protein YceI